MKLSGEEMGRLRAALLDAFPRVALLQQFVAIKLEENLASIVKDTDLSETAFELIRWADSRGRLEQLLTAAIQENPGNQKLRDVRGIIVYLQTIKEQKFEIPPDHTLDWSEYFEGAPYKKGHQIKHEADWNATLLPELLALEAQINQETDTRLIRARGQSRLSAWFAFGHCFSGVNRYTIEVDQNERLWRTGDPVKNDFRMQICSAAGSPDGEILNGAGDTVAVGISVTGSLDEDVRSYLNTNSDQVAALLLLRPERALGRDCFRSQEDVRAFADQSKEHIRTFVKKWQARRLLLFYFGPLSGACFLGHQLNAVCREIQIMEDQQPGYAPAFLLT